MFFTMRRSLVLALILLALPSPAFLAESDEDDDTTLEAQCREELGLQEGTLQGAFLFKLRRCITLKRKEAEGERTAEHKTLRRQLNEEERQKKAIGMDESSITRQLQRRAYLRSIMRSDREERGVRHSTSERQEIRAKEHLQRNGSGAQLPVSVQEGIQECLRGPVGRRWLCIHQKQRARALTVEEAPEAEDLP